MKLSQWLREAGRRHSRSDEQMVQTVHDHAVALGAVCATTESGHGDDPELHLGDAFLTEIGMSHGDLANLLRMALRAEYPGKDTYVWTQDVYDDYVVYEVSTNNQDTLYQRSYSILDGAVTFGDPTKVMMVRQYVPVSESDRDGLTERQFSQEQRDAMAADGRAMGDGGFPIATKADLKNAVQAYGRAKNKAAAKKHIIKRAKALGATDELPEDWNVSESGTDELTGDLVPLVEKAVKPDGTATIRIIAPGQGSTGYYPADVLQRDGPKVFTAGTHIYLDHPSIAEAKDRPERSVKDLAGSLTGPAEWKEDGLYAPVKFVDSVAPHVNAIASISGMSIRAGGRLGTREIDGKKVRTVESIDAAHSVDVVTIPGAGGKVIDLIEAARSRQPIPEEEDEMSAEALAEAQKKIADLEAKVAEQERKEAEAALIAEARTVVVEELKAFALTEKTRERLTGSLAAHPPLKEGALDKEALIAATKAAAQDAIEEAGQWTGGTGKVTGMGGTAPAAPAVPTLEESDKRIKAALAGL